MLDSLKDIYTLWLREMKRFIRSRARVLGSGGQPLLWLVIVGVGLGSFIAASGLGSSFNYIEFMAPGIIGMTILFSALYAGIGLIWEKQFGFLKEVLVAPVKSASIVIGKISGSSTIALLSGIFILIIVTIFGVIPVSVISAQGILSSIVFMILAAVCFVSIGVIIATSINSIESFQVVTNFLAMPLFFLSSALFPLYSAPEWLSLLADIDPLTYAVDGMRAGFGIIHTYNIWVDAAVSLFFAVAFMLIALQSFKIMRKK